MQKNQTPVSQQGSSLLEALIALLIFSFGVLGFMKLQIESMRQASDSRFVVIAGAKAQSLVDAITYEKKLDNSVPKVAVPYIDSDWKLDKGTELAAVSNGIVKPWLTRIRSSLPSGDASVECVSHVCTITIFWKPGKTAMHDKSIVTEQSARYVVQNPDA